VAYIFNDTVIWQRYVKNIFETTFQILSEEEKQTANISQHSVERKLAAVYRSFVRQDWLCAIFACEDTRSKSYAVTVRVLWGPPE
jgi:hypothetical protein